ncbi:uncharacterized protein TRIADDRAFT_58803 [Trichoplax adhaerens]|uniref:Uncharacterized protein n=1 Tax=Trichoplax adhaerens TaxID=10228 RepID=B3S3Q1_TRIAD|nr:hypothetical protein TRIADDRAFT_58803 [Trichoplax adhaerens]EDV22319.1 hypothetical protein TRIADDRAFT_58803 [Trichoplax adhaerens]|eukprot:XP_002114863.1 hypothetical protein TRIADDRAFT_58803 [Trichoplax adhaerens]
MLITLSVIASESFKSKKTWSRLVWPIQAKDSLYLLDTNRLRQAQIHTGQIRRQKIPNLKDTIAVNISIDGSFVVFIWNNNEICLWHGESRTLLTIENSKQFVENYLNQGSRVSIFVSDCGRKIIVVIDMKKILLWEADLDSFFELKGKEATASGIWSNIQPNNCSLPDEGSKEAFVETIFYFDPMIGFNCSIIFVFNNQANQLVITQILIRWTDLNEEEQVLKNIAKQSLRSSENRHQSDRKHQDEITFIPDSVYETHNPSYQTIPQAFDQRYRSELINLADICSAAKANFKAGAYVAKHSRDGDILAIAMNQKISKDTRIIFYSLRAKAIVVTDMYGCSRRDGRGKEFSITDMTWTSNSLLLIAITRNGFVAIISRAGQLLLCNTKGLGTELGPSFYLPLHPLMTIKKFSDMTGDSSSKITSPNTSEHENDDFEKLKQKFSVTVHPRLPRIITSDGYMFIIISLPAIATHCQHMISTFIQEVQVAVLRKFKDSANPIIGINTETNFSRTNNFDYLGTRSINQLLYKGSLYTGLPIGDGSGNIEQGFDHTQFGNQQLQRTISEEFNTTYGYSTTSSTTELGLNTFLNGLDYGIIEFGFPIDTLEKETAAVLGQEYAPLHVSFNGLLNAWSLLVTANIDASAGFNRDLLTWKVIQCIAQVSNQVLIFSISKFTQTDGSSNRRAHRQLTRQRSILFDLSFIQAINMVTSLYQKCMTIILWDAATRHSMQHAIFLPFSLIRAFLNIPARSDQRFILLEYCYKFTRFADQILTSTYSSIIRERNAGNKQSFQNTTNAKSSANDALHLDVTVRVANLWLYLYSHIVVTWKAVQSENIASDKIKELARSLLYNIQGVLTHYNIEIPYQDNDHACIQALNECYTMYFKGSILDAAKSLASAYQRRSDNNLLTDNFKSAHPKLSLLYMYLESYHLNDAINLVNSLIAVRHDHDASLSSINRAASYASLSAGSDISHLSVPQLFSGRQKHRSSRKKNLSNNMPHYWVKDIIDLEVVQNFARCMALYFCYGYDILISPAHHAQNCPSLFTLTCRKGEDLDLVNKTENTRLFRLKERLKGHKFLPRIKSTALEVVYKDGNRYFKLDRESIAKAVRNLTLDSVWTAKFTCYLLLTSGLLSESIWFTMQLGDWKNALVLATLYEKRYQFFQANKFVSFAELPKQLTTRYIIQSHIDSALHINKKIIEETNATASEVNDSNVTSCSGEVISSVIADVLQISALLNLSEVAPYTLSSLIRALKNKICQLDIFVPEELYLPAPPLYCPQFLDNEDEASPFTSSDTESVFRTIIYNSSQQLLNIYSSSHYISACTKWYCQKIVRAYLMKNFSNSQESHNDRNDLNNNSVLLDTNMLETHNIPATLSNYALAEDNLATIWLDQCNDINTSSSNVTEIINAISVLNSFRQLCILLWLMHVRDEFSLNYRKLMEGKNFSSSANGFNIEDFHQHCLVTLKWCLMLIHFADLLQDKATILNIMLNILIEIPISPVHAKILMMHKDEFTDSSTSSMIRKKYYRLIKNIERHVIQQTHEIHITTEEALATLSEQKQDQFQNVTIENYQIQFEICEGQDSQYNQASDYITLWPFEMDKDYLEFLDTFFLIALSKIPEISTTTNIPGVATLPPLPLLSLFRNQIAEYLNIVDGYYNTKRNTKQRYRKTNSGKIDPKDRILQKTASSAALLQNISKKSPQSTPQSARGHRLPTGATKQKVQRQRSRSFDASEKASHKGAFIHQVLLDDDSAANSDDKYRQDSENDLEKILNGPLSLLTPFAKWLLKWSAKSEPGDIQRLNIGTNRCHLISMRVILDLDIVLNSLWLLENGYQIDSSRFNDDEIVHGTHFMAESSIKTVTSDDSMASSSRLRSVSHPTPILNALNVQDHDRSDGFDSKLDLNPSSVSSIPLTKLSHDDLSMKDIDSVKSVDFYNVNEVLEHEQQNHIDDGDDANDNLIQNPLDTEKQSAYFHLNTDSSESESNNLKGVLTKQIQNIERKGDFLAMKQQNISDSTRSEGGQLHKSSQTREKISTCEIPPTDADQELSTSLDDPTKKLTNTKSNSSSLTASTPFHQAITTVDLSPSTYRSTNNQDGTLIFFDRTDNSAEEKKIMELNDSDNQYPTVIAKKELSNVDQVNLDSSGKRLDLNPDQSSKSYGGFHQEVDYDKVTDIMPTYVMAVDQIATDSNSDVCHSRDNKVLSPTHGRKITRQHQVKSSSSANEHSSTMKQEISTLRRYSKNSQDHNNKSKSYNRNALVTSHYRNSLQPDNDSESGEWNSSKIKAASSKYQISRNVKSSNKEFHDDSDEECTYRQAILNPLSNGTTDSIKLNTAKIMPTSNKNQGNKLYQHSVEGNGQESCHDQFSDTMEKDEVKITPDSVQRVVRDEMIRVLQMQNSNLMMMLQGAQESGAPLSKPALDADNIGIATQSRQFSERDNAIKINDDEKEHKKFETKVDASTSPILYQANGISQQEDEDTTRKDSSDSKLSIRTQSLNETRSIQSSCQSSIRKTDLVHSAVSSGTLPLLQANIADDEDEQLPQLDSNSLVYSGINSKLNQDHGVSMAPLYHLHSHDIAFASKEVELPLLMVDPKQLNNRVSEYRSTSLIQSYDITSIPRPEEIIKSERTAENSYPLLHVDLDTVNNNYPKRQPHNNKRNTFVSTLIPPEQISTITDWNKVPSNYLLSNGLNDVELLKCDLSLSSLNHNDKLLNEKDLSKKQPEKINVDTKEVQIDNKINHEITVTRRKRHRQQNKENFQFLNQLALDSKPIQSNSQNTATIDNDCVSSNQIKDLKEKKNKRIYRKDQPGQIRVGNAVITLKQAKVTSISDVDINGAEKKSGEIDNLSLQLSNVSQQSIPITTPEREEMQEKLLKDKEKFLNDVFDGQVPLELKNMVLFGQSVKGEQEAEDELATTEDDEVQLASNQAEIDHYNKDACVGPDIADDYNILSSKETTEVHTQTESSESKANVAGNGIHSKMEIHHLLEEYPQQPRTASNEVINQDQQPISYVSPELFLHGNNQATNSLLTLPKNTKVTLISAADTVSSNQSSHDGKQHHFIHVADIHSDHPESNFIPVRTFKPPELASSLQQDVDRLLESTDSDSKLDLHKDGKFDDIKTNDIGPDEATMSAFKSLDDMMKSVKPIAPSSENDIQVRAKTGLQRHLEGMKSRLEAIEEITQNVTNQFQDVKALAKTIERLEQARHPQLNIDNDGEDDSNPIQVTTLLEQLGQKLQPKIDHSDSNHISLQVNASPSTSLSTSKDVLSNVALEIESNVEHHVSDDRGSEESFSSTIQLSSKLPTDLASMISKQSQITDQSQDNVLTAYNSVKSIKESLPEGSSDLRSLFPDLQQSQSNVDNKEEKRKELLAWMAKRRQEQAIKYRQHLDDLKERENPSHFRYKDGKKKMGYKEIKASRKKELHQRKLKEKKYQQTRFELAFQLMGDIVTEPAPKIRKYNEVVKSSVKSYQRNGPIKQKANKSNTTENNATKRLESAFKLIEDMQLTGQEQHIIGEEGDDIEDEGAQTLSSEGYSFAPYVNDHLQQALVKNRAPFIRSQDLHLSLNQQQIEALQRAKQYSQRIDKIQQVRTKREEEQLKSKTDTNTKPRLLSSTPATLTTSQAINPRKSLASPQKVRVGFTTPVGRYKASQAKRERANRNQSYAKTKSSNKARVQQDLQQSIESDIGGWEASDVQYDDVKEILAKNNINIDNISLSSGSVSQSIDWKAVDAILAEDSSVIGGSNISSNDIHGSSILSGPTSEAPIRYGIQDHDLVLSYNPSDDFIKSNVGKAAQIRADYNHPDLKQYHVVGNSSNIRDTASIRSVSSMSGSIMSNIDWDEVDKLIEDA